MYFRDARWVDKGRKNAGGKVEIGRKKIGSPRVTNEELLHRRERLCSLWSP